MSDEDNDLFSDGNINEKLNSKNGNELFLKNNDTKYDNKSLNSKDSSLSNKDENDDEDDFYNEKTNQEYCKSDAYPTIKYPTIGDIDSHQK